MIKMGNIHIYLILPIEMEDHPLFIAICNNNMNMVELLIDYANQHPIRIDYDEENFIKNSNYSQIIKLLKSNKNSEVNNNF